MPANNTFMFTCADGHQMPVHEWLPPGPCKAVVLIAHGLAEHGGRYQRFATFLNDAGIAVFANDHRGHGLSVNRPEMLGVAGHDWFNKQVEDLNALVLSLKQRFPSALIFLFGHSMGSFIGQRFVQLHSGVVNGLILSGTNGYKDPLLPFGILLSRFLMKLKGPRFKSKLIDKLTFGKFNQAFRPNRTDFDWLSRDEKEVDAYISDPLCGFTSSVQLLHCMFIALQQTFTIKASRGIRKDLLVYAFAGDKDPVGMQGSGFLKLIENWKAAGLNHIHYQLYKDGRHEMLNETNRQEVMQHCLNWLNGVAAIEKHPVPE